MPTLLTPNVPSSVFQVWYVVYLYGLPFMLYATWAALALMDLSLRDGTPRRTTSGWSVAVLALPLLGAATYLLLAGRTLSPTARRAAVVAGLVIWLVPLAAGLWLAGGPLGPKALN
ncbi:MAG: PLDc N-terminal domain-containing protein [Proteobacteria bacterium]|nr:PLDc N-terminal domain-containing protein [Pseudomonadota bacterium]